MFGGPDTCGTGKVLKFEIPKETAKYYILEELLIDKLRMAYIIFNARPFRRNNFAPLPSHSGRRQSIAPRLYSKALFE